MFLRQLLQRVAIASSLVGCVFVAFACDNSDEEGGGKKDTILAPPINNGTNNGNDDAGDNNGGDVGDNNGVADTGDNNGNDPCGDDFCAVQETCATCPEDCGDCCGNGSCDDGETCSSCAADCGSCCGNGACDNGETCSSCEQDCGECCGNDVCDDFETCTSCEEDCGECCGNDEQDFGEECDDGNDTPGDGCENDCTYTCEVDADCDDARICSGVETCDVDTHTCSSEGALNDGDNCGGESVCGGGLCGPTCDSNPGGFALVASVSIPIRDMREAELAWSAVDDVGMILTYRSGEELTATIIDRDGAVVIEPTLLDQTDNGPGTVLPASPNGFAIFYCQSNPMFNQGLLDLAHYDAELNQLSDIRVFDSDNPGQDYTCRNSFDDEHLTVDGRYVTKFASVAGRRTYVIREPHSEDFPRTFDVNTANSPQDFFITDDGSPLFFLEGGLARRRPGTVIDEVLDPDGRGLGQVRTRADNGRDMIVYTVATTNGIGIKGAVFNGATRFGAAPIIADGVVGSVRDLRLVIMNDVNNAVVWRSSDRIWLARWDRASTTTTSTPVAILEGVDPDHFDVDAVGDDSVAAVWTTPAAIHYVRFQLCP